MILEPVDEPADGPAGWPAPAATPGGALAVAEIARLTAAILDEIEQVVVGKRKALRLILATLLADGHVLLDDVPGVAKTLAARCIADTIGLAFSRVQFTPDLLPSDITGGTVLDLQTRQAAFRPGPVFCSLLLADEVNRAPAKTQSALLEAMQEHQVTIDGIGHPLPSPFLVIATENPIESEGTYPLPEAQLDRFAMRTRLGLPELDDEREIVRRRLDRRSEVMSVNPIIDVATFLAMQAGIENVQVDQRIVNYIVDITRATRAHADLSVGASPRGTLAVLKVARGLAAVDGRDFVTPDDVRECALVALAHRVVLSPQAWARQADTESIVRRCLDTVSAPSWD